MRTLVCFGSIQKGVSRVAHTAPWLLSVLLVLSPGVGNTYITHPRIVCWRCLFAGQWQERGRTARRAPPGRGGQGCRALAKAGRGVSSSRSKAEGSGDGSGGDAGPSHGAARCPRCRAHGAHGHAGSPREGSPGRVGKPEDPAPRRPGRRDGARVGRGGRVGGGARDMRRRSPGGDEGTGHDRQAGAGERGGAAAAEAEGGAVVRSAGTGVRFLCTLV